MGAPRYAVKEEIKGVIPEGDESDGGVEMMDVSEGVDLDVSDTLVVGGLSSVTDAAGRAIAGPSVTGPGWRAAVPEREAPPGAAVGPVEGRKGGLGGAGGLGCYYGFAARGRG